MKSILTVISVFASLLVLAQKKEVPQQQMQQVYDEIKTPYKYGLVMVPENDSKKIDCPSVFRKGKNWYMTYIVFDGRGYETWLAKSKNLLQWKTLGRIMSFSDTGDWDNNQKAGYIALQDHKWGGGYKLKKFQSKYWMSYIGGKDRGYETGTLAVLHLQIKNLPVHINGSEPPNLFYLQQMLTSAGGRIKNFLRAL
jgi:hypothetical protein